jgi:hypothetical protein
VQSGATAKAMNANEAIDNTNRTSPRGSKGELDFKSKESKEFNLGDSNIMQSMETGQADESTQKPSEKPKVNEKKQNPKYHQLEEDSSMDVEADKK